MPLSAPADREPLHTRTIQCRGYLRTDGLWDIEGHIVDTKDYSFPNEWRGTIHAGEPLHEMWVRLTLDDDFVVHGAEAVTDNSPFRICGQAAPNFAVLKGLKIGKGWNRKVKELLGGPLGCTHIVDLLGPVATVAYQTINTGKFRRDGRSPSARPPGVGKPQRPPRMLNGCYAWAEEREVVQRWAPAFYTGPQAAPPAAPTEAPEAVRE